MKSFRLFLLLLFFASCTGNSNSAEEDSAVVQWISDNAVEFTTATPGSGFSDLEPLKDMVGDARIVSLGEPTHGNKEVFQLKHRMIEYLVTEMDFNIVAFEAPFGESFDVNRYVLEGVGDPEKALAGIYFWSWDTKEVLELLKWMREYNADPSHTRKVMFAGFDPQDPERAARRMLEYLEQADPDLHRDILPQLGGLQVPFSNPEYVGKRQYIPEEYDSSSYRAIEKVMQAFDDRKAEYIEHSGAAEYEISRQHAQLVRRFIESNINDASDYNQVRDYSQAENIRWWLDQQGEDSKIITWAHNSHVANATAYGDDFMGVHLREWYGEDLKIVGIFFNQGSFQAIDARIPSTGMANFTVGPAPDSTLEHTLHEAGLTIAALNLGKLPGEGEVRDWFQKVRPTQHSGGGYNPDNPGKYQWAYSLAEAYDVLVYLDSTTAVEAIDPADYEVIWMLNKRLDTAENANFETGNPGDDPPGWIAWSKFKRFDLEMTITDEYAFEGSQSAVIRRTAEPLFGEIAPNLKQQIDATPYRGNKIRLSVAARADLQENAFAFFRLEIIRQSLESVHEGEPPLFDSLDKIRIDSNDWKVYEIEVDIPEEATIMSYSMHLRDFGAVWMDAVEIEVLD